MIRVEIINKGRQPLPAYATPQSAGVDLRANIDAPVTLRPLERKLIPTGLHIALPYRGEVMVLLVNLSGEEFVVNDGERIAQMVVARHETVDFAEVDVLGDTERGEGGYGHTGVK